MHKPKSCFVVGFVMIFWYFVHGCLACYVTKAKVRPEQCVGRYL